MRLLAIIFSLPLLLAFRFNPMSQSIELGEGQKAAQFLIENDTNENMAVELKVKERLMDENGKEDLPSVKEISIFPPQMIIPPKEKRTIRVTWNGPTDITSEKAFRVIAEQLPLKVDEKTKKQSGIQMLMRYMAALYVTPKDASSKLSSKVLKSTPEELQIEIENLGNKHQVLLNPLITLTHGKKRLILKGDDLKGIAGENILANGKRIFKIKTALHPSPESSVTIKLDE